MTLADAITLDSTAAIAVLVGVLGIGLGARAVVGAAAKRRASPREKSSDALMEAMVRLAEDVAEIRRLQGTGCVFSGGKIPEHVERWLDEQVAQYELRRLRERKR